MDLTTHKATIERAGDEVEKYCGKQADGKPLLRCLVELLKRSREGAVREEKKACLLALQALKILKHGCHAIPYTGDYHLERLIASLLRRMQDCKEFDKDGSTILETATLGLQACESTARNKFKKITMTPSGLPQQFTVLVNNLLSARSKVLSELTEELYEEITGKNSNNSNPILNAILPASYIRAWKSNLQTIVDTKTWVDHHWQQDKSQALYYRVTLARAFMTLGKCSPSCDDAVRPIHEGIQQITLLGSGRFRNVGFAANTAQCLFVNAYTLLRMRQDLIFSNLQRYSSPTSPFNCLKEVTDDHFCCFADIVSAEEISSLPKQIYTYTVLAFACWDVIVGSGVALSPSAEKNIDYLSKAMLYQGDEKLHLWGSNLLHLNCDEAKSSVVLQIASTLVENGVKEAAKRWINKIENKSDKLLSIQKQLLHPDTNNDSVVESLQRLVDLHIPPESDLIFYEAELSGRIILSQRALLYGCSEASVAAGEHHLAAFFRTDPLILADNRKQSTSIIHKVFTLLHSHTEALITRGEHAILVKLLSQAVKVQGCNGGSFSARHTAIILSRVGEARAATHCHGEALRFYASAKLLLNKLLDDGSSLDLKLRIAMLTVDSQLAMGQTADAISELDHVEKTLLQMVIPSRVSQATSEPWKYLLSNVKLSPIEFISESSSDFSSKYDGLRALLHAKKSMCLSSTSWKSTLAQAIPNLINPRDAAHARVALATLDVNLRKDQNVQWFKTSADIDTEKKILEKALDTGSSKGPMQSTKTIALELVKRYGTSHQLHSAHYLNVSQGWTTRHQYHGLGTRRSIGVYDFTGDWFAEQGRLDSHLTDPDSYIERLQAFLPPSFAVVTLSIGSNGHLLIGRVESGVPPLCIGIADCENSLKESNATLNSILSRAKEHVTAVDTSQIDSLKYKQQWWNQRVEFDKEIKNCIGNLGDNILGVWRGLLLGQPLNPDIKNKLNDITQYTVTQLREILPQNHCVDSRMVALLISSAPHLHEGLLNDAVKRKGGFWRETTHMIYEGLQDVVADESLLTPEVKSKIKSIARTVHEKVYAVIPTGKRCNRQHTLMVLGSLHCFPWEATSALEGEPASRIPSLDYVMQKVCYLQAAVFFIFLRSKKNNKKQTTTTVGV